MLSTLSLLAMLLAKPIHPVSYSWTLPPPPSSWAQYREDTCHITLVSQEDTTASVVLYYFPKPFGSSTGASGLFSSDVFRRGIHRTLDRKIPYNMACPCLVCVTQFCDSSFGNTHTQCGYVLRPGEELPPGWWTPFSELADNPFFCPKRPNPIFSNGFESGSLKAWNARR